MEFDKDGAAAGSAAGIVEALLFSGGPPVTAAEIAKLIEDADEDQIVEAVAQLNQHYHRQGRPYEIGRTGLGYQMALRSQFAATIRRLQGRSREIRLSLPAIEVLSLVAYRQPVTAQTIDAIRGVDSAAIVRQLRRRNLIDAIEPAEGEPRTVYYKTTRRFLELFHLATLDDLPRVQELEKA